MGHQIATHTVTKCGTVTKCETMARCETVTKCVREPGDLHTTDEAQEGRNTCLVLANTEGLSNLPEIHVVNSCCGLED